MDYIRYGRILLNSSLSLKERLKILVKYFLIRRGARIQWERRFANVFRLHPNYGTPADKSVEKAHRLYWKPFRRRAGLSTLRVCKNISGVADPGFIPEDIFISDIEPNLNQTASVEYLTYKSFYNHWFPDNLFPRDCFHNVDGEWLDHNLNPVSFNDIKSIAEKLSYPVVLKPNRYSYGGKDVHFPVNKDELMTMLENKNNFIVQEKIKQNIFFDQFNHYGLNTVRVNIYRSVVDNRLHIVNMVLRMGVGGSLDNETAGGIATMIRKDGSLNGFAVDKYGKRYIVHPDTGVNFDHKIPAFKELKDTSLKIAGKIFYSRLISLDLCYDSEEEWRAIEVNINWTTIRFAQYHGKKFFGEFTSEVIGYCLKNHWTLKSDKH